jgi:hypothetical protein
MTVVSSSGNQCIIVNTHITNPSGGYLKINGGVANAPHADFAGEVLHLALDQSATPQQADGEFKNKRLADVW